MDSLEKSLGSAHSTAQDKQSHDKQENCKLPIIVVFVIGAPGAGKGTLCEYIAEKLEYFHLSAGDYLGDLANNPDNFPKEAYAGLSAEDLASQMKRSALLRAHQIAEILRFKLGQEYKTGRTKFIIDGFPRTAKSAEAFEEVVSSANVKTHSPLLIFMNTRSVSRSWC